MIKIIKIDKSLLAALRYYTTESNVEKEKTRQALLPYGVDLRKDKILAVGLKKETGATTEVAFDIT